jgi:hypothetical protein
MDNLEHAMRRLLLPVALLSSVLGGCAKPLVILPDNVGSDGLLVAQVSSTTWSGITNADPLVFSPEPNVGTKKYVGGLRGSTMIIPLRPGEYTLRALDETTGSNSVSTPYSTISTRYYRLYPVDKKFTIESGRATNIGMIVFESNTKLPAPISPVYVDNSEELKTYLLDRHPKMFASLKSQDFIRDVDGPLPRKDLQKLRAQLVARRAASKEWQTEHATDEIVTSAIGAIARVHRDKRGVLKLDKLYDPGTVTDLSRCGISGRRAACVLAPDTFLLLNNDVIAKPKAPPGVNINSATVFGKSGILLVDDHMRIHTSRDNGATWTAFEGVVKEEPVERRSYDPIDMNSFGIHLGKAGYYVFERHADADEAPLIYGDYESGKHRVIRFPDTVENVTVIKEIKTGLFVGPANTLFADDSMHFLDAKTGQWSMIEIPTSSCSEMVVVDAEGNHIEVRCGADDVRVTPDRGKTWWKRTVRASVFAENR